MISPPLFATRPSALIAMLLALLLLLFTAGGCKRGAAPRLLDYRELGELRVATTNDPLSQRLRPDGSSGSYEHDLLEALCERLGVRMKMTTMATAQHALRAVERGDVHLAAAGLIRNDDRDARWSSPVRPVEYVVVGKSGGAKLRSEADLAGQRIGARRGSVPATILEAMKRQLPGMNLSYAREGGEAELLDRVASGDLDFAATAMVSYQAMSKFHPGLRKAMPLTLRTGISWAIALDTEEPLATEIEAFLAESRENGLLDRLGERYFGHLKRIGDQRVAGIIERMRTRLPKYRETFIKAGRKHGLDWRLIAAVSYQESQWNPAAVSYTGVRGMMMLTVDTAARLGVRDREDPHESIMGGAKYLSLLRDQLPAEIEEPDRSWMAVAAYNVGMGHLRGAQAIARSLSKDSASWMDMKRVLPLISKPAYAARLAAGRGRGGEAVIMAESVRNYYDILVRFQPAADDLVADQDFGDNTSTPPM